MRYNYMIKFPFTKIFEGPIDDRVPLDEPVNIGDRIELPTKSGNAIFIVYEKVFYPGEVVLHLKREI